MGFDLEYSSYAVSNFFTYHFEDKAHLFIMYK